MNQKSCLILSMHYTPEPNFIVTDLAEHAARNGFKATVITTHPNYPFGKFYSGTTWWRIRVNTINDVKIVRLPHFPDHSKSIIRRAICYLSYAIFAAALAPFFCFKPDIVWVYQTPFSSALPSLFFRLVYQSKLIFMYADLWPESFLATDTVRNTYVIKACQLYRRFINKFASIIIGSTKGTCEVLSRESAVARPAIYIPVWVGGIPSALPAISQKRQKELVYAGNIGAAQALTTILEAGPELQQRHPELRISFYGSGTEEERLQLKARDLGLSNVKFYGRVSADRVFLELGNALGQIVILENSPLFRMTVPSKLFMSFAVGTPILSGLQGEALQLSKASGAAIPFDSSSKDSLINAVSCLIQMSEQKIYQKSISGRKFFFENFQRDKLLDHHLAVLRQASP